jgi:hypothetical protein
LLQKQIDGENQTTLGYHNYALQSSSEALTNCPD